MADLADSLYLRYDLRRGRALKLLINNKNMTPSPFGEGAMFLLQAECDRGHILLKISLDK